MQVGALGGPHPMWRLAEVQPMQLGLLEPMRVDVDVHAELPTEVVERSWKSRSTKSLRQRRRSADPGPRDEIVPSEADWCRRLESRVAHVKAVKRSPDYQNYLAAVDAQPEFVVRDLYDEGHLRRPRTPDPQDMTISKRMIERQVKTWRFDLKQVPKDMPSALWSLAKQAQ